MGPLSGRARLRRRRASIAYGDLPALRGVARRTLAIRTGLLLAIAGLLAAAVLVAADSGRAHSDIVPEGTTSVLVIDLSKSIIDSEFGTIGATLRRLVATDTPTGLVVFSDVAYELLPPGAPASALVPLLRYFTPRRGAYPINPWQATFRAGTTISTALDLADEMLTREQIPDGSIVLVSDLETASSDVVRLSQTLSQLSREKVPLRVVPLRPTQHARNLFTSLLGPGSLLPEPHAVAADAKHTRRTPEGKVPVQLLVLSALLLLGLGASEHWSGRLALADGRDGGL